MPSTRRSDYDITNTVRVSSPAEVLRAAEQLLVSEWPELGLEPIERAFNDFDLLSSGRMPGYAGVDTVYHDRQHTLDVTLTMTRLLVAYERQATPSEKLGPTRACLVSYWRCSTMSAICAVPTMTRSSMVPSSPATM